MNVDSLQNLASAVQAVRAHASTVEGQRRALAERMRSPPVLQDDAGAVREQVEAWTAELRRRAEDLADAHEGYSSLLSAVRGAHEEARLIIEDLMARGVAIEDFGSWATLVDPAADPVRSLDLSDVAAMIERFTRLLAAPVSGPGRDDIRRWATQDVLAWDEARRWGTSELAALETRGERLEEGYVGSDVIRERRRRLPRLIAQPFGFRVDANVEGPRGRWARRLYLSLHGEPVSNLGNDSQVHVISFTAPLARLRHMAFDDIEEVSVPEGTYEYQVTLKAEFGPNLSSGRYRWEGGAAEVPNVRELAGHTVEHVDEQEQGRAFGLQQIVFKTDAVQDSAMRLPIRGHVLITGSPGSGKTTIAVQRVVYAIREHRRELELNETAPPVFTEQNTKVFVRSRVLVPYLEVLLKQLEVPFVQVIAFDDWRIDRLRALGIISIGPDRQALQFRSDAQRDSIPLGWLKTRREVMVALQRHAASVWTAGLDVLEQRMLAVLPSLPLSSRARDEASRKVSAAIAEARIQIGRGRALAAIVELAEDLRAWMSGRRRREDPKARPTRDLDEPQLRLAEADADRLRAPLDRFVNESGEFGRVYSGFAASEAWRDHVAAFEQDPAAPAGLQDATAEFAHHLDNHGIRKSDQALLFWLALWAASGVDIDSVNERLGRSYRPFPAYAHVVVDEAQDFTEVEIDSLVQLADPSMRCVTAAGDLAQSLDPLGLTSWRRSALQITGGGTVEFRVNYRQGGHLGRLCRAYCTEVLGLPANYEPNERHLGEMPRLVRLGSLELESAFLVDDIARLRSADPEATVVVICGTLDHRRRLVDATEAALQEHFLEIRLSTANELNSQSQIHVTSADATKGLEFDAVYVLGVDLPFEVPPTRLAQHLYVAISRPRKRLVVGWRERLPEAFDTVRSWFAA